MLVPYNFKKLLKSEMNEKNITEKPLVSRIHIFVHTLKMKIIRKLGAHFLRVFSF